MKDEIIKALSISGVYNLFIVEDAANRVEKLIIQKQKEAFEAGREPDSKWYSGLRIDYQFRTFEDYLNQTKK